MDKPVLKIEKNIAVPTPNNRRDFTIPFHEMEIGDSVLIPFPDGKKEQRFVNSISSLASHYNKTNSDKIWITRTNENGVRIWRQL